MKVSIAEVLLWEAWRGGVSFVRCVAGLLDRKADTIGALEPSLDCFPNPRAHGFQSADAASTYNCLAYLDAPRSEFGSYCRISSFIRCYLVGNAGENTSERAINCREADLQGG